MKTSRQEQIAHGAKAHDHVIPTKMLGFREIAEILTQKTGTPISHQRVAYIHGRALKRLKEQIQEDPVLEQSFLECL